MFILENKYLYPQALWQWEYSHMTYSSLKKKKPEEAGTSYNLSSGKGPVYCNEHGSV